MGFRIILPSVAAVVVPMVLPANAVLRVGDAVAVVVVKKVVVGVPRPLNLLWKYDEKNNCGFFTDEFVVCSRM